MSDLEYLKIMTGCDNTALLAALIEEAELRILAITGRTLLIQALVPAVRELALCAYNRMGSEGMSTRSDGEVGISSAFEDIPKTVEQAVARYRLARVGGAYHETTSAG